jgi:hypothetical protein
MEHHIQPRARFLIALVAACAIIAILSSCGPKPTPFHVSVPTPYCGTPTLAIGSSIFNIQTFQPPSTNFLDVPTDSPKTAYWIGSTSTNYVFVISSDAQNLAMEKTFLDTIAGKTAKVTWTDCNSTSYTLSAAQPGTQANSTMPNQSRQGITIFFKQDASSALSIVKGDLSGEVITTVNTPSANNSVQAEISLLDIKPSADGKSVEITVSILNTGERSFILSNQDVYLTASGGIPVPPSASKPEIPLTIDANQKKTITFTFPRPSASTATLQIFDVEYDVEGY